MEHLVEMPNYLNLILRSISIIILLNLAFSGCTPMPIYTSKHRPGKQSAKRETSKSTKSGSVKSKSIAAKPVSGKPVKSDFYKGQVLKGEASYYGPGFHGKLTANGETYNQNGMTCAHRYLPFNTILSVTLHATGKTVKVRVNDRGPYVGDRIIDLSVGAARKLDMIKMGKGEVSATIIKLGGK
jgi:rare lipoprotein A